MTTKEVMTHKGNSKVVIKDTRAERKKAEEEFHKKLENKEINSALPGASNSEDLIKSIQELKSVYAEPYQNVEASRRVDKYRTSFIEDYEEEEATRQIEELLGFEVPPVCGYHMVVKIYVRPEELVTFMDDAGQQKSLYMPQQVSAHDKFRNCTALVIAQGRECYTSGRFAESLFAKFGRIFFNRWMTPKKEPWCRVGDWIVFPRNEGPQINYRGVPVQIIPDDKCYMIIQDPTHVTRD